MTVLGWWRRWFPKPRRAAHGRLVGRPGGFTVSDVVLVLLIVSILAAVGLPAWRAWVSRMQVEGAADRLVWELRTLQSAAIGQGKRGSMQFFPQEDRYVADILADPSTRIPPYEVKLKAMAGALDLYSVQFPAQKVEFDHTGLPSASGSIVLRAGGWEVRVMVRANGMVERSNPTQVDSPIGVAPLQLF